MPIHSLLAIETSVETGSVAYLHQGETVLEHSFSAGRKPSATLWPVLEKVMAKAGNPEAIVVGTGPGSYNGSRVGIATAQGIALVHGCGVAPICSFEGVPGLAPHALAIGDARRGSFSLQSIRDGRLNGEFKLVEKKKLEETLQKAREDGVEIFSFDQSERFPVAEELQKLIQRRQSQASLLAKAFSTRTADEQEALFHLPAEPYYLRTPHITIGKRKSLLQR